MVARTITPEEYDHFRGFLEQSSGIVLGDNKHYLITSRLNRLMGDFNIPDVTDLMKRISSDVRLKNQIMDAMTTNETSWFRDNYPYEILRQQLLPEFAKSKKQQVKVWSAACSSGQEPYSTAIVSYEYGMANPGALPGGVQIIATDLSPSVLSIAKSGIYDEMSLARGLSEERRQRYFKPAGSGLWQANDIIKKNITFREINLKDSYTSLGKFDLIFCRNVLIYFSTELKRDVLSRMAASLNPGGYLFLGGSESITNYSDGFDMVRTPLGVVYRVKAKA